jgi:NADH dehydrogenase
MEAAQTKSSEERQPDKERQSDKEQQPDKDRQPDKSRQSDEARPRIVILGGGFGGLWAAKALSGCDADVILIDRNNYHTFLPLLYQVAAAELEPEDIAYPIRSFLRGHSNTTFVMTEVTGLELDKKTLRCHDRTIKYDYLIVSVGSVTQFFGVPGAAENSFELKTLEHGVALRNHILGCFERAMYEPDEERRTQMLTFTIVGGGPTGVEFAGALSELINGPMRKDFPALDFKLVRVIILEAGSSPLLAFPKELRDYALKHMMKMDIVVLLNTIVTRVMEHTVHLKDGRVIPSDTVVWTAGVCGDETVKEWGLPTVRGNRVKTLPTLQLEGYPEVFIAGDIASVENGKHPLPMVAPVATEQGKAAAANILRMMSGKDALAFKYKDNGSMVTIGRNKAVAAIGKRTFTGFAAWVLWIVVHLLNLIGFRNRLMVLINWAWDYVFFERAIRLIIPAKKPSPEKSP